VKKPFRLRILSYMGLVLLLCFVAVAAVSAQGPGTWVSSFTVQNPSTTETASVSVEIYDSSGTSVWTDSTTIAAGQSQLWYVPNLSGLADGRYSVVVSSSIPVVAITNLQSSSPNTGGSYGGVADTETRTTLYLPGVYYEYYGYISAIALQNADTADADISITFYNASGTVVDTLTDTIPASASAVFDQADQAADLGTGYIGSAVVESTNGKSLAAMVSIYGNNEYYAYNAFASGSTVAYAPVIMNNYYGWLTSLTVQNIDTADAMVTLTYSNGVERNATIPPNTSWLQYTPNDPDIPVGALIGATVESTNGKSIVVLVNEGNFNNNSAASYNGFSDGSTTVSAPVIMNYYYDWITSVTVQNVDTADADVLLTYSNGMTKTATILPGGTALWYQPNDGLPSGFLGSIVITSTNGKKLVAIINEGNEVTSEAGDWLMCYNAFPQ